MFRCAMCRSRRRGELVGWNRVHHGLERSHDQALVPAVLEQRDPGLRAADDRMAPSGDVRVAVRARPLLPLLVHGESVGEVHPRRPDQVGVGPADSQRRVEPVELHADPVGGSFAQVPHVRVERVRSGRRGGAGAGGREQRRGLGRLPGRDEDVRRLPEHAAEWPRASVARRRPHQQVGQELVLARAEPRTLAPEVADHATEPRDLPRVSGRRLALSPRWHRPRRDRGRLRVWHVDRPRLRSDGRRWTRLRLRWLARRADRPSALARVRWMLLRLPVAAAAAPTILALPPVPHVEPPLPSSPPGRRRDLRAAFEPRRRGPAGLFFAGRGGVPERASG